MAYARVSQQNYSLSGLVGCELKAKTVGVIGTGGIGSAACRILKVGGGCCRLWMAAAADEQPCKRGVWHGLPLPCTAQWQADPCCLPTVPSF